jgi:hypothetical protein
MLNLSSKLQNIHLERRIKRMRSKVFDHMLKTRALKYRFFIWYLRFFKYIAFAPTRGEFLESYYTLMRYLDDIVDGDIQLSNGYMNEKDYLLEKIEFSKNPIDPVDEVDHLMLYCFELGKKFGEDFQNETNDILGCLMFDAKRRGKLTVFSNKELMYHFYVLDIRGTIRATLKVFKDNPEKYKFLEPLGTACRHQFNIDDFEEDIIAGYVNISREDCDRFKIKQEDLLQKSPRVESWLCYHAKQGMDLIAEHHRIMPQGKFSLLQKAVFKVVYEIPAKRTFLKTLSQSQNLNLCYDGE